LAGIFTLGMWIPAKGDAALIAYAVIFGFFSGAYVSLIGGLVAQISPLPEIGFRSGIAFLISSVGGLTTNPIAGQILASSGGWVGLKAFAGAFLLAGTGIIMAARVYHTGFKLKAVF
jgi:MFS family permease